MGPGNDRPYGGLADVLPLRKLADALDLLPVPSLVLGSDGTALAVNNEWTQFSGMPAEASWGEGWLGALEPLDRGPLRRRLEGAAAAGEPGSGDFRLTGPDGGQWCRWWWRPGAPSQLVVCAAGLDQPVPAGIGPWPHATGGSAWRLVRRSEFVNQIARALRRSHWTGAVVAVVAADLNGLRAAEGLANGAALAAARQVLAAGWPAAVGAVVSRDEFAVLCSDLRDPSGVSATTRATMGQFALPPADAAASPRPPLRTGVALASADDTAETLIARACRAMYPDGASEHAPGGPAVPAASAAALLEVATDLVNRLFGIGLKLASAASMVDGPAAGRLEGAIDDLDGMISDVRSAVFGSRFEPGPAESGE